MKIERKRDLWDLIDATPGMTQGMILDQLRRRHWTGHYFGVYGFMSKLFGPHLIELRIMLAMMVYDHQLVSYFIEDGLPRETQNMRYRTEEGERP